MRPGPILTRICLSVLSSAACRADIAYDAIANFSPQQFQTQTAAIYLGDDTTLDPAAGMNLQAITLFTRLSSSSPNPNFTGTIFVRLYSSVVVGATPRPGTLLAQSSIATTWDRAVDTAVTFNFPSIPLPTRDLWTVWSYTNQFGQPLVQNSAAIPFIRQSVNAPAVGSSTLLCTGCDDATQWQTSNVGQIPAWGIRIETVPTPGALLALALGLALHRRRALR